MQTSDELHESEEYFPKSTPILNLFGLVKQENESYTIDLDSREAKEFIGDEELSLVDPDFEKNLQSFLYHSFEFDINELTQGREEESNKTRYFGDSILCYNCGETGHIDKKCPHKDAIFCILCGSSGHIKFNCPQMVCVKCFYSGHKAKDCEEKQDARRFIECTKCYTGKHSVLDCPSIWRVYELKDVKINENNIIMSCPVCFSKSHFVDDCNFKRTKFSVFDSKFLKYLRIKK